MTKKPDAPPKQLREMLCSSSGLDASATASDILTVIEGRRREELVCYFRIAHMALVQGCSGVDTKTVDTKKALILSQINRQLEKKSLNAGV